jgi:hypothetical protein
MLDHKATFPALGIDATRERVRVVHRDASVALERIGRPTDLLFSIATFILER